MPRGHVLTTDHDGRPLKILFLIQSKDHQEIVLETLNDNVEVLRSFVTSWNRGEQHMSTTSPDTRLHISAKPATDQLWNHTNRRTRGNVHIYSVKDNVRLGYEGYSINHRDLNSHKTPDLQKAITEAETYVYTQTTKQ
ncbi:unnamed protein product [Clonostachys byssicola]|uniref:Uncharacterized protein n=1 Tax=Clonostachys byssicola TaxID=160290 RepID=A0A9N9XWZ2_9HYPO|nr:unnamed protein product [Clonostachys byssicola]